MSDNGPNALVKCIFGESIRKVLSLFGNVVKVTVPMFNEAWARTWDEALVKLPAKACCVGGEGGPACGGRGGVNSYYRSVSCARMSVADMYVRTRMMRRSQGAGKAQDRFCRCAKTSQCRSSRAPVQFASKCRLGTCEDRLSVLTCFCKGRDGPPSVRIVKRMATVRSSARLLAANAVSKTVHGKALSAREHHV